MKSFCHQADDSWSLELSGKSHDFQLACENPAQSYFIIEANNLCIEDRNSVLLANYICFKGQKVLLNT